MVKVKECKHINECDSIQERFIKDDYIINDCLICEHRYTKIDRELHDHLASTYNDHYFFGGKDGYPDYFQEKDILIEHGHKYAKRIAKFKPTGTVLDVGSASGFVLKGFIEKGWKGEGVEPNTSMVNYGKTDLGLTITNSSFEDFKSDKKFDLISMIQVVGHFYDLDKVIKKSYDLLKDDGLLLIESWDKNSIPAKILNKNWHEYSPPSVLHWFSKSSIVNVFAQHNFSPVKFGKPKKKIAIKHAFTLMENKSN